MSAVLARGVRTTGIELQYCSLLNDVASMHYSNAKMLQERPPVSTRDAYEIERLICDHLRKSIELYDDLLKRLIDGDMSNNRRLRDTPLLRSFECHYRLASLYHKLYRDEVCEARALTKTRVPGAVDKCRRVGDGDTTGYGQGAYASSAESACGACTVRAYDDGIHACASSVDNQYVERCVTCANGTCRIARTRLCRR
jgi:hypothetical protein